jgi:hypothetical protein
MGRQAVAIPLPLMLLKGMALAGDLVGKISGATPLFNSEKLKDAKQISWKCSTDRAYHDLRWSSQVDIEQAISETFTWYKENGWL